MVIYKRKEIQKKKFESYSNFQNRAKCHGTIDHVLLFSAGQKLGLVKKKRQIRQVIDPFHF